MTEALWFIGAVAFFYFSAIGFECLLNYFDD